MAISICTNRMGQSAFRFWVSGCFRSSLKLKSTTSTRCGESAPRVRHACAMRVRCIWCNFNMFRHISTSFDWNLLLSTVQHVSSMNIISKFLLALHKDLIFVQGFFDHLGMAQKWGSNGSTKFTMSGSQVSFAELVSIHEPSPRWSKSRNGGFLGHGGTASHHPF